MNGVALKMLFGDRAKYLGLIFGVAFATLLITQQSSLFVGLMARTASVIRDTQEANLWVMDPTVVYIDNARAMRDTELARVRGVPGVAWAVPLFKANGAVRTPDQRNEGVLIIGVDDATLIGVPQKFLLGSRENLRSPDAIAIDRAGFLRLYPGEPLSLGKTLELNDRRAVITAIVQATPAFQTQTIIYTRYSQAIRYTPQGRNQLTFIVGRAAPDTDPAIIATRIEQATGLRSRTASVFAWETINYYLSNTGIPINFGVVIILGIIVGVAIVGLTFNLFISENLKQYAALKAIGVTNGRLLRMVLLQASVVGFVGYGIGTGLAAAFFEFVVKNSLNLRGFYLPWWIAAAVFIMVAVIMVLATVTSLRRVLVVDPATVFRG